MVDRPPFARRARIAAAIAVAALVLALTAAACGSQIPFGTPRASGVGPPTGAPSAGVPSAGVPSTGVPSTGASIPASPGPTVGATTTPTALPGSDAPGTQAPLPTPATTAVTYSVATTSLRITLPPGWVGYDTASPEAAILAATSENPELTEAFDRLGSGQLLFVAVDASATGEGQPPSMTIGSIGGPIPSTILLESLAQTTAAQVRATQPVDGEVEQRTLELPSGPAVNLRWQLEAAGDAEALGLDAYLLSVGDRTYLVTFAAPISVREGFEPAFEAIVGSMQAG